MPQEEIAPACLRLGGGCSAVITLISVKGLKSLDAGMEGAVLAPVMVRRAIPAAVVELLAEQIVDEVVETFGVVPMSGGEPHEHRDDAGLRNPPSALPLPEALTPYEGGGVPRWQAKPGQVKKRVRRRNPLRRIVAAAPTPVRILQRNQPGAPALCRNLGSLGSYGRCGARKQVSVHPPADRRVALQQPVDQLVLRGSHRHHPARGH